MRPRVYKRYGVWVLNYAGNLYRFENWTVSVHAIEQDWIRNILGDLVPQEMYYFWL